MKNGIPWKTVNAPYLFKMADVYITDIPKEISDHTPITKFGTDFGEYNKYIHYDMIPVWNIRRLKLDSVGFPLLVAIMKIMSTQYQFGNTEQNMLIL